MNIKIEYISDAPQFIPQVAKWRKSHWGVFRPQYTLLDWQKDIALNKDRVPLTIVAYEESTKHFLGTAALKYGGMKEYRKDEVWLSSVFTNPQERNKGVATHLIKSIITIADKLGINIILLCTHTDGRLYEKLGWKTLETVNYLGKKTLIMERSTSIKYKR